MTQERPELRVGISVDDFKAFYWMQFELVAFARQLGLSPQGSKPVLSERIERRLAGLPCDTPPKSKKPKHRDSDAPLERSTPVVNYHSDAKTREFFKREAGPDFHFTYHLNQFRQARPSLTYGDLLDEWGAERERRRSGTYQASLAEHGKWNRFVRDYFADPNNGGNSLGDAAAAWSKTKAERGEHRYAPEPGSSPS